jgi:hypothetical protein
MKFTYKLDDKVTELISKINNPINVDDLLANVTKQIAEKM